MAESTPLIFVVIFRPTVYYVLVWPGGVVVRALDWRLKRYLVRISAVPLSGNYFRQVVHTHVPLSPSSIIWYRSRAVMPCGWEGNRRSDFALALRHRLQWFIHLRVHGLRKGDEHPAYTPHGVWHSFTFATYAWWLGIRVVSSWTRAQKGPGSNRSRDAVG